MAENPGGIKEWIKNKLPKEKAQLLETLIQTGLELIKQGDYQQAVDYFADEGHIKKAGFSGLDTFGMPISRESPDEYSDQLLIGIINDIASRTKLDFGGQYGLMPNPEDDFKSAKSKGIVPRLRLARPKFFSGDKELPIPKLVSQNMALVYAEEYLHGLQVSRRGSIAGVEDSEIDVAKYMLDKGVELTPQFLARYDRAAKLSINL